MQDLWCQALEWIIETSSTYGINPLILGVLYFGTIPVSVVCFAWLLRNYRGGYSLLWPAVGMFLSFIGTYAYLFLMARRLPLWVYFIIFILMGIGCWQLLRQFRKVR